MASDAPFLESLWRQGIAPKYEPTRENLSDDYENNETVARVVRAMRDSSALILCAGVVFEKWEPTIGQIVRWQ